MSKPTRPIWKIVISELLRYVLIAVVFVCTLLIVAWMSLAWGPTE